jgi:hypothetical protein
MARPISIRDGGRAQCLSLVVVHFVNYMTTVILSGAVFQA